MKIAIRVDSSTRIGSGHFVRCLTLAQELKRCDITVEFICRRHEGNLIDTICSDFPVIELPLPKAETQTAPDEDYASWLGVSQEEDATDTIAALKGYRTDWLIVDHYSLDKIWETALRPYVGSIMVIDDLANRAHDCDLLLDQNLYSDMDSRYRELIPSQCKKLFGPKFALLRPEFNEARKKLRIRNGVVNRIMVFMGGTDPTNETAKVIQALKNLKIECFVDVIVGRANPQKSAIEQECSTLKNFNFYEQTHKMAKLMAQADLAIGASGSTNWERCSLGLPSLVIPIAKNQKEICCSLDARNALIAISVDIPVSILDIQKKIEAIIWNKAKLQSISENAFNLVDCKGVERVRSCLLKSLQITILTDKESWINDYLFEFVTKLRDSEHNVIWIHDINQFKTSNGDLAFFLSCSQIIPHEMLFNHTHNLVVHGSDLPAGKGWSPVSWQILEGKNEIPICLFEADAKVDNGDIYFKQAMIFNGLELIEQIRKKVVETTKRLCLQFIESYPFIVNKAKKQKGDETFYRRRTAIDSEIDINKTIQDQFNLLRVVDNDKYPAFFMVKNQKYILRIEKE